MQAMSRTPQPPAADYLQPMPRLVRDEAGDERLLGRRGAFHVDGYFYCAAQHRVEHTFPLTEDSVRCPWTNCHLLYFVVGYGTMADGTDITWAVEITKDEYHRLRHMTGRDKIRYLGITWEPPIVHR